MDAAVSLFFFPLLPRHRGVIHVHGCPQGISLILMPHERSLTSGINECWGVTPFSPGFFLGIPSNIGVAQEVGRTGFRLKNDL